MALELESLTLEGCRPTPLASYLKALGILRLISSPANNVTGKAADPGARGWWENECFHLRTALDRDSLVRFFLEDYAPSPIIAPWNGRAGFLEGDAGDASNREGAKLMREIESSDCDRLEPVRRTVSSLRKDDHLEEFNRLRARQKELEKASKWLEGDGKRSNDEELKQVKNRSKEIKSSLLPGLRSATSSHHVSYIDTCYVLSSDEAAAPLLGSGGNDGSRDFGVNFAQRLRELVDFNDGKPTDHADAELESAVFDVVGQLEKRGSMGHFSPGQGGPNATTGYEGYNSLNSWDVVLAMEGAMAFAGALTRRWGATAGRGAFPFTFEPTGAGAGSLSSEDPNRPRGEIWTPIWGKPARFVEVAAIFSEGRLTLGQRSARTGLDAARAVARIGASRGINGFERYSMIQPDAKMPYQGTPLGRFNVPERPRRDLLGDLEAGGWLDGVRRVVGNRKEAPARARQAMRRLEDALFLMTSANRASEGARNALVAIGNLVDWLVTNPNARQKCRPPPPISSDWIREADDGSAEFRIAAALAGVGLPALARRQEVSLTPLGNGSEDESTDTPDAPIPQALTGDRPRMQQNISMPMAAHFAPLALDKFFYKGAVSDRRAWSGDMPPAVVWGAGSLIPNMIAVLERRLIDAATYGLGDKVLAGATTARRADMTALLSGDFDDARCDALLRGLVWARPAHLPRQHAVVPGGSGRIEKVPFAYAALKPLFVPDDTLRRTGALAETALLPIPPGLVARLRSGGGSPDGRATDDAVRSAFARARASGLSSPFDPSRSGGHETGFSGGRIGVGTRADRLAAALLIPIGRSALSALLERAYPGALPDDDGQSDPQPLEDTSNAA